MCGSKAESKNEANPKTNNLSLQGVDGVTVAGDGNAVQLVDPGAFDLAGEALDGVGVVIDGVFNYLEESQRQTQAGYTAALDKVDESNKHALAAINTANKSEGAGVVDTVARVAMVGAGAWAATKIFKAVK